MPDAVRTEVPADDVGGARTALAARGLGGSRRLIPTPGLVCDLPLLRDNVAAMAGAVAADGLRLRPHAKSHKSALIAALQLEHGAVGIACAKVAEAEVLVDRLCGGADEDRIDVLVTSPLGDPRPAARAAQLARRCDLSVVVDRAGGIDELAEAAGQAGTALTVLCDVDVGLGRTGVTGPDAALQIVRALSGHPRLRFGGVQGYAGHVQHAPTRSERRSGARLAGERLAAVVDALTAEGHAVPIRTGGGTGTAGMEAELGALDEIQAGSYVFMDREYRDALGDDPEGRFAQSLTIATTVVSANQQGFVTVDAGLKAMATDAGPPAVVGRDSEYVFFGDEHGMVTDGSARRLRAGDRVELVPPHCDPTVDRYDRMWLVEGDVLIGWTPVDARGRSQ
jgi:D-serine deaminase-like pyridoxal phosphate-dependent protein